MSIILTYHSIVDAFSHQVSINPDKILIKQIDADKSFSQVEYDARCLAAGLQNMGLQQGDRIGLYCINGTEFIISYLAILIMGGIVVPINLLLKPKEISYVLSDAQVSGLIYHTDFNEQVESFDSDVDIQQVMVIGENKTSHENYLSTLSQSYTLQAVTIELSDLAAILYTSGTTGFPKGAMLTHRNLMANTQSVRSSMAIKSTDCLLVVLPMFHSFACTVGMLTPMLHGMSIAPVVKFDPALVAETIEQTQATIFLGVPSMYAVLLRQTQQQIEQWSSIRLAISGGSAMPLQVMQDFEEKFSFLIYEGDGPTECSPVTCVNPIGGLRKIGSVGLAVADVRFKICDKSGVEVKQGNMGEICVSGPNVMQGYWNLAKETQLTFFDQWLRTGDLGYLDEDGYLFMVDRIKDMIIVNGMNVYPRIIEDMLSTHPAIQESAVVGEPNDLHGENVVAHVVLKAASTTTGLAIRQFCRENLGTHEVPRKVILRDSLPKNATGKILKREMRKEGEIERGIDSRTKHG